MEEKEGKEIIHLEDVDEKTPFTDERKTSAVENGTTVDQEKEEEEEDGEKKSFWMKLTQDKVYREKYFLTLNLIASFFALGWMAGQAGPSFLDWKIITNVHIDRASAFFTAGGIGYLVGTLVTGYVFDRMKDKVFLVVIGLVGMGVTTAVIPFSYFYELMIFVQFARGFAAGILDTSGNTLISRIWGSDGRMFMQSIHFGFAFGGAVSPLAVAPFLTPQPDPVLENKVHGTLTSASVNTTNIQNYEVMNTSFTTNYTLQFTNMTESAPEERESTLYIAYSVTAILSILCAIPAFFICFRDRQKRKREEGKDNENMSPTPEKKHDVKMTKRVKIIVIIVLALIFCFYCAVEDSFISFLTTFCVRQMKWTKVKGAMVTSVFWAAFAAGRLAGIFLVLVFAPFTLIFVHATIELAALAGIFLSAVFEFDVGMWIFSPILGFAMSVIFPSIFTWTEVSFMRVTGRISSLFLIVASAGSSVNPIVLGKIMDEFSDMWYVYLLCIQAVVLYITLFVALFISKKVVQPRQSEEGTSKDQNQSML